LNSQEKTLARYLFQLKLHKADGQKFEDLFISIMNYAEPSFQSIKAWGTIGDRKNDGYIKNTETYFQVFAPEDIRKSYPKAVKKLEEDFEGLKKQWPNVLNFYFVLNDYYKGVNADCEKAIIRIKKIHNLNETGIKTAKDLENLLFTLSDDQIFTIAGNLPDPARLKTLNYSILNEIISYIMGLPLDKSHSDNIYLPDWNDKIKFNQLSDLSECYLNNGYIQVGLLEKYLKNNSNFLADVLKEKMRQIYIAEKQKNKKSDELFWAVVDHASPKSESQYQSSVIVVMAKYFETCDIFEEPGIDNDNAE